MRNGGSRIGLFPDDIVVDGKKTILDCKSTQHTKCGSGSVC